MAFYFDTSALVKFIVAEPESDALRSWLLERNREIVACDLVRTELLRAVRRVLPDRMVLAREVLDSVTLLKVSTTIFEAAGRLDPVDVRSLDAVHLAAAIELGDDLEALVTYDARLEVAAMSNGLPVVAPR